MYTICIYIYMYIYIHKKCAPWMDLECLSHFLRRFLGWIWLFPGEEWFRFLGEMRAWIPNRSGSSSWFWTDSDSHNKSQTSLVSTGTTNLKNSEAQASYQTYSTICWFQYWSIEKHRCLDGWPFLKSKWTIPTLRSWYPILNGRWRDSWTIDILFAHGHVDPKNDL